jgi:hypothetical protein
MKWISISSLLLLACACTDNKEVGCKESATSVLIHDRWEEADEALLECRASSVSTLDASGDFDGDGIPNGDDFAPSCNQIENPACLIR